MSGAHDRGLDGTGEVEHVADVTNTRMSTADGHHGDGSRWPDSQNDRLWKVSCHSWSDVQSLRLPHGHVRGRSADNIVNPRPSRSTGSYALWHGDTLLLVSRAVAALTDGDLPCQSRSTFPVLMRGQPRSIGAFSTPGFRQSSPSTAVIVSRCRRYRAILN